MHAADDEAHADRSSPAHDAAPAATTSPFVLSCDAAPFIPSFMRTAPAPTVESDNGSFTVVGSSDVEEAPLRSLTPPPMADALPPSVNYTAPCAAPGRTLAGCSSSCNGAPPDDMWRGFLQGVSEEEVQMMISMLPRDIQLAFDDQLRAAHHSRQTAGQATMSRHGAGRGRGRAGARTTVSPVLSAAHATFSQLSQDQLVMLEEFFVRSEMGGNDAYGGRGYASGAPDGLHAGTERGLADHARATQPSAAADAAAGVDHEQQAMFMDEDEGMNSDEEVWLLEQMMAADTAGDHGAQAS